MNVIAWRGADVIVCIDLGGARALFLHLLASLCASYVRTSTLGALKNGRTFVRPSKVTISKFGNQIVTTDTAGSISITAT